MKLRTIKRRTFLRGLGVSLAVPLLERDLAATAGKTGAPPMRMVCVANPLGFVPDAFFPRDIGDGFKTSELLKPLPRGKYSVFSNLDHGVSGGHQAVHAYLSGIRDNESSGYPERNISMDQRAAEHVGPRTRFPSIVAAVGRPTGVIQCRSSWTRNGVSVPPVYDERLLFESLFITGSAEERRRQREAMRRNASVLDGIREQARDFKRTLGRNDQQKLDEYFDSVRAVETQMQMSRGWIDRPKPQVDYRLPSGPQAFTRQLPVFYDLIALALQTDSTRVATLSIPGTLPVGDLGLSGSYHAFSHHGLDPRLRGGLLTIEKFQLQQFARFVEKLDAIGQPDGSSLLDRSMLLCGSGMGNGSSHSNKNLPIVLAGGGFKHGSHIALPNDGHRRIPLNNLYTTMLQRFGVEIERFNTGTGTINGLELA